MQAPTFFTIGQSAIRVELRRSPRARNIRLTFDPEQGQVTLTLPRLISVNQGKEFAESKQKWIEKHWRKAQEQTKRSPRNYRPGEVFYYLGEALELAFCPHRLKGSCAHRVCRVHGDQLILCLKSSHRVDQIKKTVERFYRQKASEIIHDRLEHLNEDYGFKYHQVAFRNQKTRWGSCTAKGNLNFNWRLVMAPIEVIDYIVAHELCHLKQMNHSGKFWELVAQTIPDHKRWRKWLKDNHFLLTL